MHAVGGMAGQVHAWLLVGGAAIALRRRWCAWRGGLPASRLVPALRRFGRRLCRRIDRNHPQWQVLDATGDGLGLVLRFAGQELALPIDELARHCEAFPSAMERQLAEFLRLARGSLVQVGELLFDQVFLHLLPQLRTTAWLRQRAPAMGPASIVSRPLADELEVCYVIDEPEAMTFVTRAHLAHWGQVPERIHELALANLRRRGPLLAELSTTRATKVSMGDGYDAARLLLVPETWDRVQAPTLCFAVPERDALWLAPADAPVTLAELMATTRAQCRASEHPLSEKLYQLAGSGWRTL